MKKGQLRADRPGDWKGIEGLKKEFQEEKIGFGGVRGERYYR